MSQATESASDVISLPKGGGAIQGMGETFSPDLHTGTGNFTVPISVPSGRNDFQPDVNLVYSTGQGNGPFGLGWNLSLPEVSRKTSKGVPRYRDSSDDPNDWDTFLLSGAEDLVPIRPMEYARPDGEKLVPIQNPTGKDWADAPVIQFRPRTEGLFAKILHYRDGPQDFWMVCSKDGLVSIYGTPRPQNAGHDWQDTSVIQDPRHKSRIFTWKLTETRDPFGNRIVYEYEQSGASFGQTSSDLHLKRIQYVDHETGHTGQNFLVSIDFELQDRPDPFSTYRPGFEIRTWKRCSSIAIHTHPNRQTKLLKSYDLIYLDQRSDLEDLTDQLPLNRSSLLNQVEVKGHDGMETEALPPLQFAYSTFQPRERDFSPVKGDALPARSLRRPELELADLTGNGLPDIVELSGVPRSWINLGQGRFDRPHTMDRAPAGLSVTDPGVQLLDANGDGRLNLMTCENGVCGYFALSFDGQWSKDSFHKYPAAPSLDFQDSNLRLVDLDGDGVTDALRSGSRFECFFNDPDKGWAETRRVKRQNRESFPDVMFSDPRVHWADMSGDGLQDIVLIHDNHIVYWPNLGHGDWGRRVNMERSPRLPFEYDPSRLLMGDLDGDGLSDLVYVEDNQVTLWINQSGNSWSDPVTIRGTPRVTDLDAVLLADLLGTGVAGILWSADARSHGPGRDRMFFLDLTGGTKPYLLTEMDNNLGAVTRVGYASSTEYFLSDQGKPQSRWQTHLPFPVLVVSRVEVIDAISGGKLTTEYTYHHGHWDGGEREFRGFGTVEQYDSESFADYNMPGLHGEDVTFNKVVAEDHFSPPTLTKTWFHQGATGPEHGGWRVNKYSHEYWRGDPQRLEQAIGPDAQRYLQDSELTRPAKRDALRALRGRVLRTELYALDGTELEDRPYTVTERAHRVREENTPDPGDIEQPVFFPHPVAERKTQWERGEDPQTTVSFTEDFDEHGQPGQETEVALPRRSKKRAGIEVVKRGQLSGDEINETRVLATHTRTQYAQPNADSDRSIRDRTAQQRSFELQNPLEVTESDPDNLNQVLQDQIAAAGKVHQTFQTEVDNWLANPGSTSAVNLFSHTLNHYDGPAFEGLPVGKVGKYGALIRTEELVFSAAHLDNIYGNRRPVYLGGGAGLPSGAPDDFGEGSGYRWENGTTGPYLSGYYADVTRRRHDFQDENAAINRGLVTATQDPLGHETTIEHDKFRLLPVRLSNPIGLETTADYDYRVLKPKKMTDPNGHATHVRYTPLGQVDRRFLESRDGIGGTEDKPEVRYEYDFRVYERTRQPIFAHKIERVEHASENISDETIESRVYSDGFGRQLQSRAQAPELIFGDATNGDDVGLPSDLREPIKKAQGHRDPNRVIVSGWKRYDNKGQAVEQYEPFFARGWAFQPEAEAKQGEHVTQYYDPRGQVIRTVNPDGSEQRVIFGIPENLSRPDAFTPTPWESYTYDSNDNAGRTHFSDNSLKTVEHHQDTPSSEIRDALGRTIATLTRGRNTGSPSNPPQLYVTQVRYDIRDNEIEIVDALGRPAFTHAYDLLDNQLRTDSIDAGLSTVVQDAVGNPVEQRDSKGNIVLQQFDNLNRPTHLWAQDDGSPGRVTLRERLIYGDNALGVSEGYVRDSNLRGRIFKHYDEAGLLRFDSYDFKGNLTQKTRWVIKDEALSLSWTADWNAPNAEEKLEEEEEGYQTNVIFDALNRPNQMTYPTDVEDQRAVLKPTYDRSGNLEKVTLDDETYVEQLAYSARGQRKLVVYGNGIMTRYTYDPKTFLLARLRSENVQSMQNRDQWEGTGQVLQDLLYSYDLIGNILSIDDRTPNCGVVNTSQGRDRLVREFQYDPLYRLTEATGRACNDTGTPRSPNNGQSCGYISVSDGGPPTNNFTNSPDRTELYTQTYHYDPADNMTKLTYKADSGTWKRQFEIETNSNRLEKLTQGGVESTFQHDANGNLQQQATERHFTWDHADRLIAYENRPSGGNQASVEARYLYGADGMRVKKWVRTNGSGKGESTVSIDDIFEHQHWKKNGSEGDTFRLHVMDDQKRIAIARRGDRHPDDAGPKVQFHLGDHLGSSSLVMGNDGQFINREEYFPYGETSYGSFGQKRYRFTGKERDEESGFYYHGARYYAPWLGRWTATDPIQLADGINRYAYVGNNPLRAIDPSGNQSNNQTESSNRRNPFKPHESATSSGESTSGQEFERTSKKHSDRSVVKKTIRSFADKQGLSNWKASKKLGWDPSKLGFDRPGARGGPGGEEVSVKDVKGLSHGFLLFGKELLQTGITRHFYALKASRIPNETIGRVKAGEVNPSGKPRGTLGEAAEQAVKQRRTLEKATRGRQPKWAGDVSAARNKGKYGDPLGPKTADEARIRDKGPNKTNLEVTESSGKTSSGFNNLGRIMGLFGGAFDLLDAYIMSETYERTGGIKSGGRMFIVNPHKAPPGVYRKLTGGSVIKTKTGELKPGPI